VGSGMASGSGGIDVDAVMPQIPDATDSSIVDASVPDVVDANAPEGPTEIKIALVQQAGSHFTLTPTFHAFETFASPNTAGNSIIVLGFWDALGYSATVTDSVGNIYASTTVVSNPRGGALQIFYASRVLHGANTVTLTMGAGFNSYVGLAIFEYAGLSGSDILEGSAGQ
jgi:hypothetical protein